MNERAFEYKHHASFELVETNDEGTIWLYIYFKGVRCGFAKMSRVSQRRFYIKTLGIYPEYRSKRVNGKLVTPHEKLGSNLIEGVNQLLRSRNAVGHLENFIEDFDKEELYTSHGWEQLTRLNYYFFDGTHDKTGQTLLST
jgi:hypothetical protein